MIDAKELRIGNIVEPLTKSPSAVTGILGQNVMDGDLVLVFVEYESFLQQHLLPVAITEEWLIIFGFKKQGEYSYPIHDKTDINNSYEIEGLPFTGCLWLNHKTHGAYFDYNYSVGWANGNVCVTREVYSIHDLQNLYFSLAGKELKAKITTENG